MNYLMNGGMVLWSILALSVFALAILLERMYKLINLENIREAAILKSLMREGNLAAINERLEKSRTHISKGVSLVLNSSEQNVNLIKEKINRLILSISLELEKNLWFVRVIMYITPILGLLGTVTGMMKVFASLSYSNINHSQFSLGISEALITTAAGLASLIPLSILYGFVEKKIDKILLELESSSLEAMTIMKGDN